MRAFAGESQARNRYTFAAGMAKQMKLEVIEKLFNFTANQEKEHAEIFYNYLKPFASTTIHIDGGYPVDLYDSIQEVLRGAMHNEYEEYEDVYPAFGDIAKEEGFTNIANTFYQIAEIEKTHGQRFEHYAKLVESQTLFSQDQDTCWLCLNCGHIHRGKDAPNACPVCHHNQGYFIRYQDI